MKKYFASMLVVFGTTAALSQDNDAPEFAGENFSLEGAVSLFKKANTLEQFEEAINNEKNDVNNLDLNNDGDIDYITVEDIMEDDKHVIVLTVLLGDNDKQDIATIAIEKTGKEEAQLQIIGDEDLYADNTIAEPFDTKDAMDNNQKGPAMPEVLTSRVVVNVWGWPAVRFIYAPGYRVWVSSVRWAAYPRWWRPWRPIRHTMFVSRCHVHKTYIHRTPTRRVVVHKTYGPRRHSSTLVVKGKRGTTVVHKGRRGNVKAVRVRRR
ncbi:hypothetical protein [Flavobacterium sp. GCM10027622]|uniref:hypothetical protein n=1 Tax=unclassified Flavobacterium TaxID=196869 RepID=UPI00360D2D00